MQKKSGYRVLLIEDDRIDQMAFTRLIQEEELSYDCILADTVSDAKNILNNHEFDVIIADYLLKDGTAFDIFDLVKETPIIFATGAGNEKLAVKAMKAGAYDYLIKNPSRSYLTILPLIIENAINHAKMVREVKAYHENLEDIIRERTEQLKAEKELLSVTFSSMTDGIIVVDADKNVVLLNNVAETLTGNKLEYARGKNIDEIFHLIDEHSREPVENPIDKVLTKGNIQTMIEPGILVITDKSEHSVSIAAAPISKNKGIVSGVVILLHDRSQELEIDRMKTDFISSVSHELRTPLTSIKAYTETILRTPGMPEEQKREFLITIDKESNRLAELVNGLLEISKLESGRIDVVKQSIDVVEVIEQIMLALKCPADNKNITLENTVNGIIPPFWGHESRIRSLISNLINNAIKFTPDGGRVSIHIEHKNNELEIYVSDTGIGIPQKEIPYIFDRFYRVHQSDRQIPGTGLGLAIVKEIAAMHGGKVDVKSELGKGTTFKIMLPLTEKCECPTGSGDSPAMNLF
jgi:PAS domain S-box-containing protein